MGGEHGLKSIVMKIYKSRAWLLGVAAVLTIAGYYHFFTEEVVVNQVVDGDTFSATTSDGKTIWVRLKDADAPENTQPFGPESKHVLAQLVGKKITLRYGLKRRGHYGRYLATVVYHNRNINRMLVRHGYAWAYGSRYKHLQAYARAHRLGLWGGNNPIPPKMWRKYHPHK